MTRSTLAACSLLLVTTVACDAAPTDSANPNTPEASGKADGTADEDTEIITIAQAGAFSDTEETRFPVAIHYGFTDRHAPGWPGLGDVEVHYDEDGRSLPVRVRVPDDVDASLLAFVIQFETDAYGGHWSDDQFIALDAPEGRMVRLPVHNGAGYPFTEECYGITVDGAQYDGLIDGVLYGFTDRDADAYRADNNVPWFDVFDTPAHEGVLDVVHAHDGGFYGTMRMLAEWVRVPAGHNLVFKLDISKFGGQCGIDGDTVHYEDTYTKTYFAE